MFVSKFQDGLRKTKLLFPRDIEVAQAEIRHSFFEFFKARGYTQLPAESIIPKENANLLFTNATVIPLKRFIMDENIPVPGLMVEQPCLRVQNLGHMFDESFMPEYMGYFKMLGILSNPAWYEKLVEESYVYLVDVLRVPRNDIKILASSRDKHFLSVWYQKCRDFIEEDTRDEDFYAWTYGKEDIIGRGITFSIRQNGERFNDIGNVVEMTKKGKVVGYEFGFGMETIIARLCKLDGPFEAARISKVVPFKTDGLVKKLQDYIACVVVLYAQGIRPGNGKARFITKKTVKGLIYLRKKLGIDIDQLKSFLSGFERLEFGQDTGIAEKVVDDIMSYEVAHRRNLELFKSYVKNQKRLIDRGQNKPGTVVDNLKKKAFERYHLSRDEYQKIVGYWFSNI